MTRLALVPASLTILMLLAVPLASAHPACRLIDVATEFYCAYPENPVEEVFYSVCAPAAEASETLGDRAADRCEDLIG